MKQLLTVPEVATILGVSLAFVKKYSAERVIPTIKVGRTSRFREEDIEAFVQKRRQA